MKICPPQSGHRKGVVEKVNHTAAQPWWRTLADDLSVEAAQASLDTFAAMRGDTRMRPGPGGKSTVATVAAAEPLRLAPATPYPVIITDSKGGSAPTKSGRIRTTNGSGPVSDTGRVYECRNRWWNPHGTVQEVEAPTRLVAATVAQCRRSAARFSATSASFWRCPPWSVHDERMGGEYMNLKKIVVRKPGPVRLTQMCNQYGYCNCCCPG